MGEKTKKIGEAIFKDIMGTIRIMPIEVWVLKDLQHAKNEETHLLTIPEVPVLQAMIWVGLRIYLSN